MSAPLQSAYARRLLLPLLACVQLQFSMVTAQLYGLSASVQLNRYSADGTSAAIGPAHPSFLQAQNLAALDAAGGIYYFVEYSGGAPALVGLSLSTGAVLSRWRCLLRRARRRVPNGGSDLRECGHSDRTAKGRRLAVPLLRE